MKDINFSVQRDGFADKIFLERWSPRSFLPEVISSENLKKIFDAARWSPSCVNEQPWLFFTASRDSESFNEFLSCLKESNQLWAKNAGTIGFLISRRFFKTKDRENQLADFDCGASWMALTIQARLLGYFTHGMGGIYRDRIEKLLELDGTKYKVVMGFALGKLAPKNLLPAELQEKENPSDREMLKVIWKDL